MNELAAALSGQQQTFWATIAQVNAAVVIALVVEIGTAARRYKARDILDPDLRTLGAILVNGLVVVIYLGAAGTAVYGLFQSLGVLQGGADVSAPVTLRGAVWTLIAVILALLGPLIAFVQYIIGTIAEGTIDFISIIRALIRQRRAKKLTKRTEGGIQAFIAHLEDPTRGTWDSGLGLIEARTVREMLDDGFNVLEFWGPEQMDVWLLKLTRGTVTVQFGIERGFSDGIHLAAVGVAPPPRTIYVGPAFDFMHFVWAVRTGVKQPKTAATQLVDLSFRTGDGRALSDWRAVVDWLGHATPADVAAINRTHEARSAWINAHYFRPTRTPKAAELREGGRELEESARA